MLKTKPDEIANQSQAPHETSAAVRAPRRGLWQEWLRSLLLFCGVSVYVELCLHLCVYRSLDRRAVYLVLFGLLGGTVCTLLTTHPCPRSPGRSWACFWSPCRCCLPRCS